MMYYRIDFTRYSPTGRTPDTIRGGVCALVGEQWSDPPVWSGDKVCGSMSLLPPPLPSDEIVSALQHVCYMMVDGESSRGERTFSSGAIPGPGDPQYSWSIFTDGRPPADYVEQQCRASFGSAPREPTAADIAWLIVANAQTVDLRGCSLPRRTTDPLATVAPAPRANSSLRYRKAHSTRDKFGIETVWVEGSNMLLQRAPGDPWGVLPYEDEVEALEAFSYVAGRSGTR